MKKLFSFVVAALMSATMFVSAQTSNYVVPTGGADLYYHYVGEEITGDDPITWDFSQLQSTDVAYQGTNIHDDKLIEFQGLGLYKYCYYASRQCGTGETYGPVLWNSGTSWDIANPQARNDSLTKRNPERLPAIITPKFANGIKMIIVEGWGHNKLSTMFVQTEDADGKWISPKGKGIFADDNHYFASLRNNAIVPDTTVFIAKNVKSVKLHRQDQPYAFITKITVVPNPSPAHAVVEEVGTYPHDKAIVDIVPSKDGKKLYALHTGTACVEIIETETMTSKGYLKDVPTAIPAVGGGIAVDANGAIYACNANGATSAADLFIYKWADETADPVVFASLGKSNSFTKYGAQVGASNFRIGTSMDVKIDASGNGFILIPYSSATSVCMLYVPVVNNVAGTAQEVKLNGVASSVVKGTPSASGLVQNSYAKFTDLQINDDNTFWYDTYCYRPILCSYNIDAEGVFTADSVAIFPEMSDPTALNINACGINSFWYKGRQYAVLGANIANANAMYMAKNLVMLSKITIGDGIEAEWIQGLPDGGCGQGAANSSVAATRGRYAYNSEEDAVYLFSFCSTKDAGKNNIYCHKMYYVGEPVALTGFSLDKSLLEVEVGARGALACTYAPADATDLTTTWTTSDPTVATVVNGVVTGLKEGTAVITATAGTFTATCNVTIYGHYTPNIYASDLKVIEVSEENMAKLSYVLNAEASSVVINVLDAEGNIVKSVPAKGLKRGLNTVVVDLGFVPAGDYAWSVTATAPATTTTNVLPQRSIYNFFSPGGMAIDNNFESPYFGNVYVTETRENKTTGAGRVVSEGIQILTPDMEGNGVSYNGGVAWVEDGGYDGNGYVAGKMGPQRLTIDENGLVYVNDNERYGDWNTTGLWSMNPADPSANFVPVLDLAGFKDIYNRVNAMLVKGKDADRVLYICDWSDSIVAYPLGNAGTISQKGTKWAPWAEPLHAQPLREFANDPINNGIWVFSINTDGTRGGVAYFNASGERKFCGTEINNPQGAGAVSPDGTLLAFANGTNVVVYTIAFDETGVPTLTLKETIGTAAESGPGFAFDVANNLYIASSSSEWMTVYPMAKAENTFTTPAPKASVLTANTKTIGIPEIDPGYNVGGENADFASFYDACVAVNEAMLAKKIGGGIMLNICADLVETKNCALINNSKYIMYIQGSESLDKNPTITFAETKDPNKGPSGGFVIGVHHRNGIAHEDTVPTHDIRIYNVNFTTTSDYGNSGYMIVYYGNVSSGSYGCDLNGCVLENKRVSSSSSYAVTFRTQSSGVGHPDGIGINGCEIIATASGASQGVYFNGSSAKVATEYPTNCWVANSKITATSRGVFLNGSSNADIEGNEFHVKGGNGFMAAGIYGNKAADTVFVANNQFVEMTTAHEGAAGYGMTGILASGGGVWSIENNYFGGFNATGAGNTRLVGVRCGSSCVVRHNTFVMPELTGTPTTPLLSADPISCLYLASAGHTVQNNLFACYETKANVSLVRGSLEGSFKGNDMFIAPAENSKAVFVDGAAPAATFSAIAEGIQTLNKNVAVAFDSIYVLTEASMVEAIGVPAIAEVTKDIEGNTRNTPLVIPGCYEPKNINTGEPTSLAEIEEDEMDVQKIIRDGQLYIIRGGVLYNMQGAVVE